MLGMPTSGAAAAAAPAEECSDDGRPSVTCCTPEEKVGKDEAVACATDDEDTDTEDVPSTPPPPPAKRRRLDRHPGGLPQLTENSVPAPARVTGSAVALAPRTQHQLLRPAPPPCASPRPYDVPLYVGEGRAPLPPAPLSPTLPPPPPPRVERSRDA
eukprot:Rhum_TRINITY_DN19648_c0_g1::Rhum_TRINITY_DN19648_c0_g1_i1::g.170363::m.170363